MPEAATMHTAVTTTRVRYPETDRMGVAHHTHHFVWFELGRTELMRDAGWTYAALEDRDGVFFPVVEAGARYAAPGRYDEELTITTRVTAITGARVRFDYEIARKATGETVSTGYTIHGCVGRNGRPMRVPASLKTSLGAAAERDRP